MNVIQEPAVADFTVGREGCVPLMIVEHWTDCVGILGDEILEGKTSRQVTAHFRVGADGTVHQHVKVGDTAWGAGDWQVNLRAINIEHEGAPGVPITDACYASSIQLQAQLCEMFNINPLGTVTFTTTLSGEQTYPTLCPHGRIHPDQCPGTLDIGRIASGITNTNVTGVDQPIHQPPANATVTSETFVPVTFTVQTLYSAHLRNRQDLQGVIEFTVPKGTNLVAHEAVTGDVVTVNGVESDQWYRVSFEGNDYLFISATISKRL